jgi:hypothetical protein
MQINYKRSSYILAVALVLSLFVTVAVLAGNVDSPGGSNDLASQMYTLEDIYQRLANGVAATKKTTFGEPSSGPGGTMHTLDDIYAAIPEGGCTCSGTLVGTRWCDNGDGTVTDLLGGPDSTGQCLVWLKDAGCIGAALWLDEYDNGSLTWVAGAVTEAGVLSSGDCDLSDGSVLGDWRLPTIKELFAIADSNGTEYIREDTPRAFINFPTPPPGEPPLIYWSSTTNVNDVEEAWAVYLGDGNMYTEVKDGNFGMYVLPVRNED